MNLYRSHPELVTSLVIVNHEILNMLDVDKMKRKNTIDICQGLEKDASISCKINSLGIQEPAS